MHEHIGPQISNPTENFNENRFGNDIIIPKINIPNAWNKLRIKNGKPVYIPTFNSPVWFSLSYARSVYII